MDAIIQKAAKTIQDLGIANREMLEPHIQQWSNRPPSTDTSSEDMDLAGFLTALFKAKVITRKQGRTLLNMLTGDQHVGPPPDDPYVGRRFGQFVAEEFIGAGAMGKVYRATREGTLERDYVIKVFLANTDPVACARFRREGEVMSALDHPHIVKIVAAGQEGNTPFLVLEYVEGPTLQAMLEKRGKFSWKSATRAIKQLALALQMAHEAGVIHRDMKPSNVLVARGGLLKVFDFGLAKASDSKEVSQAGEILGSPAFMAPEQWGDHEVDGRADLFALGVMYYELISGEVPFKGRTPTDYSTSIQLGKFTPLHDLVPETPLNVSSVVSQLLEKDRNHRTPSAKALVADLDRVLRKKGPNVPRLEVKGGDGSEDRFPLVGASSFKVSGVDMDAPIFQDAPGIEADHALLERTANGLLLRAKGEAASATRVNGNPVREIILRDKDRVQFGEGDELVYRVGNLGIGVTARFAPPSDRFAAEKAEAHGTVDSGPPVVVPGLLAAALQDAGHPRAFQSCFEALDPTTLDVDLDITQRRLLGAGLDRELIEKALTRARTLGQERMWHLADQLFAATKENLGRSVEAWLAWWFEVRGRYPRQLRRPGPRARGRLKIRTGGADESAWDQEVSLDEGEVWTLGRGDDVEITVKERSVSRKHLTILRLNTRFAFKDLGSRFGTNVEGTRMDVGMLRHGDELELGKVTLKFEDVSMESPDERAGSPFLEIDPNTFQALVELREPSTTVTLVRLLDLAVLGDYCVSNAGPYEDFATVGSLVMGFLEHQRSLAMEALPLIAGKNLGTEAEAWQAWLNEVAPTLKGQVVPLGWTE